jgi:Uma2 family endonuclease
MTITTDRPLQQKPLSFDEFVAQYGDDKRYELIDGEVFDLEPTGLHEQVAGFITNQAGYQIVVAQLPWIVLQRPLLRPAHIDMTAFRPDVAVIDELALAAEPIWPEQSILTQGNSIKFVVEVVSSNWQNDYSRKLEDYETLGIPEYWIADHAGLVGCRLLRIKQSGLCRQKIYLLQKIWDNRSTLLLPHHYSTSFHRSNSTQSISN